MRRLKVYLPLVIWMGVIFTASTGLGSTKHTSRIIAPLLRFFKPDIREETINAIQAVVRKCGHLSEYAVLAMIWWGSVRVARKVRPLFANWRWAEACRIVLYCAIYAVSDEIHQRFVADRQGQILDVLIDTAGATCGILILWAIARWPRKGE